MLSQDFFQICGRKGDRIFRRSQGLRMKIMAPLQSKFGKKMRKVFSNEHFVIQSNLLPRLVSREHMSRHVFAQSVAGDKGFNTTRVSAVPLGATLCALWVGGSALGFNTLYLWFVILNFNFSQEWSLVYFFSQSSVRGCSRLPGWQKLTGQLG